MAEEDFAASQDELRRMDALNNTTVEDIENVIKSRYTFSGMLTSLLILTPFVAILSLLLAILFLKREPF